MCVCFCFRPLVLFFNKDLTVKRFRIASQAKNVRRKILGQKLVNFFSLEKNLKNLNTRETRNPEEKQRKNQKLEGLQETVCTIRGKVTKNFETIGFRWCIRHTHTEPRCTTTTAFKLFDACSQCAHTIWLQAT